MTRPENRLWVALDLETTGLDPATDRIVEIGAVRFDDEGRELGRFDELVNPRRPVSPGAFAVHRIPAAELASAPGIEEVLPRFLNWLEAPSPAGLVAHNARFDAAFLGWEIGRMGMDVPSLPLHDTLALSRRQLPGAPNHRLETLTGLLGLDPGRAHRALSDSLCVMGLWLALDGPERATISYPIVRCDDGSTPPRGWDRLEQAVARKWVLRIEYDGGTRGTAPRELTPIRFLHLGGTTYLIGMCHCDRVEKRFRLDRIRRYEVIVTAASDAPP